MASDYRLNFGFRRSDESMATREGRFKTPPGFDAARVSDGIYKAGGWGDPGCRPTREPCAPPPGARSRSGRRTCRRVRRDPEANVAAALIIQCVGRGARVHEPHAATSFVAFFAELGAIRFCRD